MARVMTFLQPLLIIASIVPVLYAIQCYNGNQGVYVNNAQYLPQIDCGTAINTCTKSVDLIGQNAVRSCGSSYTCTFANGTASPRGFCYNISSAQTLCCCYGNLCNDSARPGLNIVYLILPLLILFTFQSRRILY